MSFEPEARLDIDALLAMKEELEARYGRPVDVVEKEALRNPWRRHEILRTREVISMPLDVKDAAQFPHVPGRPGIADAIRDFARRQKLAFAEEEE